MKFACKRSLSTIFQGTQTVVFTPVIGGVRLLTAVHEHARSAGRERLWTALCDTGGIVSVVPAVFIEEMNYPAGGKTLPLRAFDGRPQTFPWYYVLIGLPGLSLFRAQAIAPQDTDPHRPREHITLGCDILSRLRLHCDSTLPWDLDAIPPAESAWTWEYDR